jgi:hypothetical protein
MTASRSRKSDCDRGADCWEVSRVALTMVRSRVLRRPRRDSREKKLGCVSGSDDEKKGMREMIMRPRSSSRSWADVWARSTTAATTCRGGRWTVEFGDGGLGLARLR